MKNSKLDAFKGFEQKEEASHVMGGAMEQTWQTCYEPTDGGKDTAVEKWPDEGGRVRRFVYKPLSPSY